MDWVSIVSLVLGLVSIGIAIFAVVTTNRTEKRIIKLCKKIRKLIDGCEEDF